MIRVAFVVAAFYGPGIPLYLLGCAALPDARNPGRNRAGSVLATVLLVGAAVGLALLMFGGEGGWLAPLMVCLGLLAVLHVTRGGKGPAVAGAPGVAPATTTAPGEGQRAGDPALGTGESGAGGETTTAGSAGTATAAGTTTSASAADGTTTSATAAGAPAPTPAAGTPTSGSAAFGTAASPPAAASTAAAGTADSPTEAVRTSRGPGPAAEPPPASPPAWDPLGAAPFAWDLPEPGPEDPPPTEDHSRLTLTTLALALLAGGAVGTLALLVPGAVGPAAAPAAALAVVGVGLVIGAFRHSGRWLLPFAVVLAVATWLVSALPWADLRGGVGTIADAPRSAAAVAPEYRRGVGDVALDLSELDLRTPPGAPETTVRTAARVGIGSITVTVPRNADVVVRGSSGLGDVTVAGQSRSGSGASLTVVDNGPDGPGGGRIELDADAALGTVTVGRG